MTRKKKVTIPDKAWKSIVSSFKRLKPAPFIATTLSFEIQNAPEIFADREPDLYGGLYNRKDGACNRDIQNGKSSFIIPVGYATCKKEVKPLRHFFIKVIPRNVKLFFSTINTQQMLIKLCSVICTCVIGIAFTGCVTPKQVAPTQQLPRLKEVFRNDFAIGAALNIQQIEEKDSGAVILVPTQFNMVTPENIMKAEIIHPKWDVYNFEPGDKLVEYSRKYNLKINGHTLVWHSQLPVFAKNIQSIDSFKTFFSNHVTTVAKHYSGKVFSWDVVNEALEEDGTLRKSIFLQMLGDDYIVEAFRLAEKASPNTELYYNDYNIEQPKKRAGAIALIKKIQAAGVRIDGVGIQGHWNVSAIPLKEIEESIEKFSALGIKVMFTELDLSVLPNPWDNNGADVNKKEEYNGKMNPYPNGLPDSIQAKLGAGYANLFTLFLKHKNSINRITFWGVNDGHSWLNNWPIRGRTNYPLLFDRNFKPKPAFYEVLEAKKKFDPKLKAF